MTTKIGVIGCGNMGSALVRGIVGARVVAAAQIAAWDPDSRRRSALAKSCRIRAARSNVEVASARVLLLAVKPQQMESVLTEIRPFLSHRPLVISIAAGITTTKIEQWLGSSIPVIRVMPNTPALVGEGISVLAAGRRAGPRHLKLAERLFRAVGRVERLPEKQLDAVTAVSGSGPAYFFFLMEQMIETGVKLGLPRDAAVRLVLGTAVGAAKLAASSGESPSTLRARVTSQKGTTEAALRAFEKAGVGPAIRSGIQAAARRSKELSK